MLRSWTDQVRVYLHPESIALVRMGRGLRRRITAQQVIPVEAKGEHIWDGPITTLQEALRKPEWQGMPITVILSGHFMRYRVVPWDIRLNEEEKAALLRHQFGEIYGEAARAWQVTLADSGYGKPGLACGVDSRLMDALQQACSGVRLVSVRPYLMTAFNRWRREIDTQKAWFILAEPSCLTIAFLWEGAWRSIRTQSRTLGGETSLEVVLTREALQLGVEMADSTVYFSCPDRLSSKPRLAEQFNVKMLNLPSVLGVSQNNYYTAMAL